MTFLVFEGVPDYFLATKSLKPLSINRICLLQTHYKTLTADQLQTNWAPVLANLGLLLATSVQCLTTMLAAFRFYRLVRLIVAGEQQTSWSSSRHRSSSCCSSSVGSKQKLVQKWLVQQTPSQLDRPRQQTNYPGKAYSNKMVSSILKLIFTYLQSCIQLKKKI